MNCIFSIFFTTLLFCSYDGLSESFDSIKVNKKRPNVIMILADDLGVGDTSVEPFTGSGIKTPELEKMAKSGTIMSNFHAAAPICSPSRAAILTGMYPWRYSIAGVYDYGLPQKSNRDDWLPQVPTTAMAFRDAGYYTAHLGKWHIGGMRNFDLQMRKDSKKRVCPHPGPNQMGFDEYVTMEEGPDSPRQTNLQRGNILHSEGGRYMYRNDVMEGGGCPGDLRILSDCEANHAIRVMKETVAREQPFFIQLWFYAPHGPWETIPRGKAMYPELMQKKPCNPNILGRNCRFEQYMTMVSAMDYSIGTVLEAIRQLGIENDTLVVFTSDNGPEDDAGGAGPFKGRKRLLTEGGLRVPAIFQWPGVIPAGYVVKSFGMHTDLFPTFLEAAGVSTPPHALFDGISLLPLLRGEGAKKKGMSLVSSEVSPRDMYFQHGALKFSDRIAMWHTDYESSRATVGWMLDFKIHIDRNGKPSGFYDMLIDPFERNNLLQTRVHNMKCNTNNITTRGLKTFLDRNLRAEKCVQELIFTHLLPVVQDFDKYGADAHKLYLKQHPDREFIYTPRVKQNLKLLNKEQLCKTTESCVCSIPSGKTVDTLPFKDLDSAIRHVHPKPKNVSALLGLSVKGVTSLKLAMLRNSA